MKIGIVGAGQLGSWLAEKLAEKHEIIVFSRAAGFDLREPKTAEAAASLCDAIVNCAAMTDVDRCESDMVEAVEANSILPEVLAQACRKSGTKLAHISTDYVYGEQPDDLPIAEEAECKPCNFYGATKLAGDRAVERALSGTETSWIILRPSWLYSPKGERSFIWKIWRALRENETIRVVDDQIGVPTSTETVRFALEMWLDGKLQPGVYNIRDKCGYKAPTRLEIAQFIREVIGSTCEITPAKTSDFPSPAHRQLWSFLATTKLDSALLNLQLADPSRPVEAFSSWQANVREMLTSSSQSSLQD